MRRKATGLIGLLLWGLAAYPQGGKEEIKSRLDSYFLNYQTPYTSPTDRCRIEKVNVDGETQTVEVYLNELFAGQSFNTEKIGEIYGEVGRLLPSP